MADWILYLGGAHENVHADSRAGEEQAVSTAFFVAEPALILGEVGMGRL